MGGMFFAEILAGWIYRIRVFNYCYYFPSSSFLKKAVSYVEFELEKEKVCSFFE